MRITLKRGTWIKGKPVAAGEINVDAETAKELIALGLVEGHEPEPRLHIVTRGILHHGQPREG